MLSLFFFLCRSRALDLRVVEPPSFKANGLFVGKGGGLSVVVDSRLDVVDVSTNEVLHKSLVKHIVSANNETELLTFATDAVVTLGDQRGDTLDSAWRYPDAATTRGRRATESMTFRDRYADFETFRQRRLENVAPATIESRFLSMKSRRPEATRVVLSGLKSSSVSRLAANVFGTDVVAPREDDSDALRAAFVAVRDALEPSSPLIDFVLSRRQHFSTLCRKVLDSPLDRVARYRAFENDVLLLDNLDSRKFLGADAYYGARAATGEDPEACLAHVCRHAHDLLLQNNNT